MPSPKQRRKYAANVLYRPGWAGLGWAGWAGLGWLGRAGLAGLWGVKVKTSEVSQLQWLAAGGCTPHLLS